MYEVGRLCIKLAGRDANKKCVIIEVLDDVYVMIDGQTRRRKCNITHLEPLDKFLKLSKGASHKDVVSVLKKEKIIVVDTKPKKKVEKPKKQVKADKPVKEEKTKKKTKDKNKTLKARETQRVSGPLKSEISEEPISESKVKEETAEKPSKKTASKKKETKKK